MQTRHHEASGRLVLKGVPASSGIAIGKAFVLDADLPVDATERVTPDRIANELQRFQSALESVTTELTQAMELAVHEGATAVSIVESFQLVASDALVHQSIAQHIASGLSAEASVAREFDAHKTVLYRSGDAFLRSRAQDLEFVKERIIAALRKRMLSHAQGTDSIVVAPHVTPQDMLFFKTTQTLGYLTEVGGINSHVCILARDMGIPAVIGVAQATENICTGSLLIVDGFSGVVVVDPDEATLVEYQQKMTQAEAYREKLGELVHKPTETTDGVRLALLANVDEPDNVDDAMMAGAEGVGLVRTEYLLMRLGRYPTEAEQTAWYLDIAQRTYPSQVTFRAFDVGSDKFRQGIPHVEDNPALGLRGVRFLLYRPDLFQQQVCAVLRASIHGNVRLMLPMVSTLEEVERSKALIEECKQHLASQGVEFDASMPVGMMIETPAAAMMADLFAQHADFLSIGTNDLAQYALATDRTNDLVADIFDPMHPAVIRMVHMIVQAARTHNKSVSVCGEMAGHASATEMLVGLGITELSVTPRLLLEVKRRILHANYNDCVLLAEQLLNCATVKDVHRILDSLSVSSKNDLLA
ncbi:MAG: phosphoenolpyruvate--protein phosphotransferase [Bradyrhizobiaceae bacterium]|nr:phosphoenolpyruvate--protein phosphotransferase [Bradyrhizobiaceae bacterium]